MNRQTCFALGLVAAVGASACQKDTPVNPTPPAPTGTTLSGNVTVAGGARIAGASIAIFDGPNAGRATTTNASGEYILQDLTMGNANVTANSTIYDEVVLGAFLSGGNTLNFVFATPACQTANTGQVSFGNRSAATVQQIVWDGVAYATIAPGQTSAPLTATAGIPHTLSFTVGITGEPACTDSMPVLTRCERGRVITCAS